MSNDGDSDWEEEDSGCLYSLPNKLVDYHTHKRVVIRSPWLQLPNVCAQVIIALYIIFIQLLFHLRFMDTETPVVTALGHLEKLISNWDVCHDADFDCMMHDSEVQPSYCATGVNLSFGPTTSRGLPAGQTQRRIERCWRNDVHEDPQTSFIIPTMVTFIEQTWMPGATDWHNDKVEEYYMENIEEFHIRLFHSFVAVGLGLSGSADTSQGYFSGTGLSDTLQQIPCDDTESYSCPHDSGSGALPACGITDVRGRGNVCVSTQWGDVISVSAFLAAVLPSDGSVEHILDMPRPLLNNFTYRQSGYSVILEIKYDNMNRYWSNFFSVGLAQWITPRPSYELHVQPVLAQRSRVVSHTDIFRIADLTTGVVDPMRRTLRRRTGIRVMISTSGSVGKASIRQLLLSVTTAFALLKLANMLVDHVIVRLYWKRRGLFHVGVLSDIYLHDRSATCHAFKERMDEAQLELLHEQGNLKDEDILWLRHMEFHNEEVELSTRMSPSA